MLPPDDTYRDETGTDEDTASRALGVDVWALFNYIPRLLSDWFGVVPVLASIGVPLIIISPFLLALAIVGACTAYVLVLFYSSIFPTFYLSHKIYKVLEFPTLHHHFFPKSHTSLKHLLKLSNQILLHLLFLGL